MRRLKRSNSAAITSAVWLCPPMPLSVAHPGEASLTHYELSKITHPPDAPPGAPGRPVSDPHEDADGGDESLRKGSGMGKRVSPTAKLPIPLDQEVASIAHENVTNEELAALIQRTTEAAKAYIRGDMRTYFTLIRGGDDFTLMSPFGGEPTRGFDDPSPKRLEALEHYFQNGEAELEVVQTYTSGDLVVLVVIERQHGEVGGLPEQDWSLRVTVVFRRDGSEWRQVHRHADPLDHGISLEQLSALARG